MVVLVLLYGCCIVLTLWGLFESFKIVRNGEQKKLNSILVVISLLLQLQKLISLEAHIYIYMLKVHKQD